MNKTRTVSVVITTRNRYQVLRRCITSIIDSETKPTEIIVIDDQSTDETATFTGQDITGVPLRIIRLTTHTMMSQARTIGAQNATGDLILLIDDDNVLDSRMIGFLVAAFSAHPDYGILGPVMYTFSTQQVQTAFQRINLATGYTWGPSTVPKTALVASDGVPNVFMVRRTVFEKCGYFDADLLATYSEPDFAWRILRHGWKCGVVTNAKTFHDNLPHGTLIPRTMGGGTFPQKSYCMIRNRMVMVRRYGKWWEQIIFFLFFHWWWPVVYSLLMLRYMRFNLIAWYWLGWRDGWYYLLSSRLVNSFSSSQT